MPQLSGDAVNDNVDISVLNFSTPADEAIKSEQTLEINAFGTTNAFSDYYALALRVQQLFLMEPGTNPAAVEMGIGIKNYLMEIADTQTLDEIYAVSKYQLSRYLPTEEIRDITVESILDASNIRKLYVKVYLNKTDEDFKAGMFAIGIHLDSLKSTVSSNIYV